MFVSCSNGIPLVTIGTLMDANAPSASPFPIQEAEASAKIATQPMLEEIRAISEEDIGKNDVESLPNKEESTKGLEEALSAVEKVSVKWNDNGLLRRFHVLHSEDPFANLLSIINTIAPRFEGKLTWKDEEDDFIELSSNIEWKEALLHPSSKPILRIFSAPNKQPEESAQEAEDGEEKPEEKTDDETPLEKNFKIWLAAREEEKEEEEKKRREAALAVFIPAPNEDPTPTRILRCEHDLNNRLRKNIDCKKYFCKVSIFWNACVVSVTPKAIGCYAGTPYIGTTETPKVHSRYCRVTHPNQKIEECVALLEKMGFDNCNGWLTKLAEKYNGCAEEVIANAHIDDPAVNQ